MEGLASSNRNCYASGQKRFAEFCTQLGKLGPHGSPCPLDEWTLCLFVRPATIKVYLSAVRALHIEQSFPDLLVDCFRLQRVARGIK